MKTFLTFFVLFFSPCVFADDISDFQIEDISISENLLDYFSENFIKENTAFGNYDHLEQPNKYYELFLVDYKDQLNYELDKYDALKIFYTKDDSFVTKKNSNDYYIHGITGVIYYPDNYEDCKIKRNSIVKELSRIFKEVKVEGPVTESHIADKTGKSTIDTFAFWFDDGDLVMVTCYDWTKKMQYYDNLKIQLMKDELNNWLTGN